jgi:hypothetical protein
MTVYYVASADRRLGEYSDLKSALAAMEHYTSVGGYDMVIVERSDK